MPITVSTSTSSGLKRRKNKKNLSLSLSSNLLVGKQAPKTSFIIPKDQNINAYPNGPIEIIPHLYLGSEKNSNDLDGLRELSIQAILNVAAEVNNPFEYLFQPMDDLLSQTIIPSPSLSKASTISSTSSIQTEDYPMMNTAMGYHKLNWEHNQDNLVLELQKAVDIIDKARSAGQNILVHCQCGIARSATVIIAYVMKTMRLSMQDAYDFVKKTSPVISPNLGLLFQLREYEQTLKTNKSTTLSWKSKLSTPKSLFS
ncbi:hypothetical protein G6F57_000111 [Rhizopus arrhizus]|uniref:protein-tyrosine-phosphatase n=3 Tax=Rhizopus TaxID=4842 RepID=I1BKL1_RHIO9|nr:hypothetical protein RO3G_01445 [Rhizopus delemar RA 99-880]KAG0750629.1 hypothetical protein G6F23_000014 [Rhizopus arrhizus]KAG1049614.1 hypothetical protein G6F43_008064 [Rhizopus delemar]KAG0770495.1 hypothetical protein G6F24_000148 [Rhizopus arrhizus]KAG0797997.1 hypothetical protein G6F21_000088 [Rhizopus arrhizus]|eukprot:EIE76741.1 hypothetical protein RO3G_01445 [Rhizopus delemar RA 99-880]